MSEINSKDYWNERFSSNDWEKYDGDQQSQYFASLALEIMPNWLVSEISHGDFLITDVGCAEGGGTALLQKKFPMAKVKGIDFSEAAIKKAKECHPNCEFEVGDIQADFGASDITFVSNVLEHMKQPGDVLKKVLAQTKHYSILIHPYKDEGEYSEHFQLFDEKFFPEECEGFRISFFKIVDCKIRNSIYWPGKQILVVYSKISESHKERLLSDLYDNKEMDIFEERLSSLTEQKNFLEKENRVASDLLAQSEQVSKELMEQKKALEEKLALSEKEINDLEIKMQVIEDELHESDTSKKELEEKLRYSADELHLLQKKDEAYCEIEKELVLYKKVVSSAVSQCQILISSRLFKFMHLLNRLHYQLITGTWHQKKEFFRWIIGKLTHTQPLDKNHIYNPLFRIVEALDVPENCKIVEVSGEDVTEEEQRIQAFKHDDWKPVLDAAYKKPDIIILGVIDYSFRYQRPQHLASYFAQSGHRVFYVDANFDFEQHCNELKDGLYEVKLKLVKHPAVYKLDESEYDGLYGSFRNLLEDEYVRDAMLIIDYPTWFPVAERAAKEYGFKVITDYMDDFTGFLNTSTKELKDRCIQMLRGSDMVIASSNFLHDIAAKYNSAVNVVRNGTEYEYFHTAYEEGRKENTRKIIGYYGAISDWFNVDAVCYCAEHLPECDVVLVGEVTAHRKELQKHENIKLIGEVPYKELTPWLAKFDVCLIPFDTSTDLIKATNPVKFYEYLSAGKKVVATEIPELEPFRDNFVYLANDNETFCNYVKMCLEGSDTLASEEECFEFARNNDWSERAKSFLEYSLNTFPKVSIVVLCYNQLDYTKKCVESIIKRTAYPNYELILVDNASTDDTREYITSLAVKYPFVKAICNNSNLGFAAGNNSGIREASGDYIVLLNNDTVVSRGWITGLVKRFNHSKTGIVGCVTNSIGNEAEVDIDYVDIADMPRFARNYTGAHMNENYPHDGVLAMFCVMFSRNLMESIGLLDENYGVGMFEDDDYSVAAEEAGYALILAEDVFVHHFGSISFKKLEDEKYRKTFEENRKYFEKKWNRKWQMHHYRTGHASRVS